MAPAHRWSPPGWSARPPAPCCPLARATASSSYLRTVATWQLLGRVLELGSLACLLGAFGLPVSATTAVLALAAQGTGRTVIAGPLGAGVSTLPLLYALSHLHPHQIAVSSVAAF